MVGKSDRQLRNKRSVIMDSPSSDAGSIETLYKKINIDDESTEENMDIRNYWRQRPNKIFFLNNGYITSFSSKKCIFNPPMPPSRYENWLVEEDGDSTLVTLNAYPTNDNRNEIIQAFHKNVTDKVPLRVCLTQNGVRYDYGWFLPIELGPGNIMTMRSNNDEVLYGRLPNEDFTRNPSVVKYDPETDHSFNSLKELGWQRFMTHLEIPHLVEKYVPEFNTDLGPYRPDFIIYPKSEKLKAILEIKPASPYCDQEAKMRDVVEQTGIPGFILMGKHTLPFDNMQFRGKSLSYAHAHGAKAIKFSWDAKRKGVRRSEGYVWMCNDRRKPYLRKYQPYIVNRARGIGKFDWKHQKIVDAYQHATKVLADAKRAHVSEKRNNFFYVNKHINKKTS